MSTNLYRLAHPITSLRVEDNGGHAKITVFTNHKNSGTLVVDSREVSEDVFRLLYTFRGESIGVWSVGLRGYQCLDWWKGEPARTTQLIAEEGYLCKIVDGKVQIEYGRE